MYLLYLHVLYTGTSSSIYFYVFFFTFSSLMGCKRKLQKHCDISWSHLPSMVCSTQVLLLSFVHEHLFNLSFYHVLFVCLHFAVLFPVILRLRRRTVARASGLWTGLFRFEHLLSIQQMSM